MADQHHGTETQALSEKQKELLREFDRMIEPNSAVMKKLDQKSKGAKTNG
jgi:hypothetical protein